MAEGLVPYLAEDLVPDLVQDLVQDLVGKSGSDLVQMWNLELAKLELPLEKERPKEQVVLPLEPKGCLDDLGTQKHRREQSQEADDRRRIRIRVYPRLFAVS